MVIGFENVQSFVTMLVAIFAVVATVWSGVKAIKEAIKPLTDLKERIEDDEKKLDNDNKRLNDLEKSNKLLLKAIDQLIEHEITNNHSDKLKEVQEEIHDYLYDK